MKRMMLWQLTMKFCVLRNLVIVKAALGDKKGKKEILHTTYVNIRV